MFRDIKGFVKNCVVCTSYKSRVSTPHMAYYPIPLRPFNRVHMVLLTGFCESRLGNMHLLVVIDELTRYVKAYPIRNKTAV